MLCATWYEGTTQLLSLTEFKIYFSFILLAEQITNEGGEETGVRIETPDDELQKMPHTKAWKSKPQPRLEPAL